jgi:hypothetical protein
MPKTREFNVRVEDHPGALAKFCRALADRGVNILAFQAFPFEGQASIRMVVDNPTNAKAALEAQHVPYKETDVAQVKLAHRPGELARAAARLGDANLNITHAYAGVEPGTNTPVLILGVSDVSQAAKILDEAAGKAA